MNEYLTGVGSQQAGGHRQTGRLARSVGADDAVEARYGNVEAQPIHRDFAIEGLDQPPHLKCWNGGRSGRGPGQCANRVCAVGRAHRECGSRHVSTVKALSYSALGRREEITDPDILPENRPELHQPDEEGTAGGHDSARCHASTGRQRAGIRTSGARPHVSLGDSLLQRGADGDLDTVAGGDLNPPHRCGGCGQCVRLRSTRSIDP